MLQRSMAALAVLVSTSFLTVPAPASGAPVSATGVTEIYVSAFTALQDLGLTVELLGDDAAVFQPPSLPNPNVYFPITAFDPDELQVFHEGIGLALNDVELRNFIVDADDGVVFADVIAPISGMIEDAPVFDVVDCAVLGGCVGVDGVTVVDGLGLELSAAARGVLGTEFMLTDDILPAGTPIGVANSFLASVPEPGTALLLLSGLGGLAGFGGRRRN